MERFKRGKVVESTIEFDDVDPVVCERHLNGRPQEDGKCLVKLVVNEKEGKAELLKLEERV